MIFSENNGILRWSKREAYIMQIEPQSVALNLEEIYDIFIEADEHAHSVFITTISNHVERMYDLYASKHPEHEPGLLTQDMPEVIGDLLVFDMKKSDKLSLLNF